MLRVAILYDAPCTSNFYFRWIGNGVVAFLPGPLANAGRHLEMSVLNVCGWSPGGPGILNDSNVIRIAFFEKFPFNVLFHINSIMKVVKNDHFTYLKFLNLALMTIT